MMGSSFGAADDGNGSNILIVKERQMVIASHGAKSSRFQCGWRDLTFVLTVIHNIAESAVAWIVISWVVNSCQQHCPTDGSVVIQCRVQIIVFVMQTVETKMTCC